MLTPKDFDFGPSCNMWTAVSPWVVHVLFYSLYYPTRHSHAHSPPQKLSSTSAHTPHSPKTYPVDLCVHSPVRKFVQTWEHTMGWSPVWPYCDTSFSLLSYVDKLFAQKGNKCSCNYLGDGIASRHLLSMYGAPLFWSLRNLVMTAVQFSVWFSDIP